MYRKLLLATLLGAFFGGVGVAIAQTYTIFSYARVLNILDVRTSIQNQDSAEDVVIDDNLTITGTCTGCGGGGGAPTTADYLVGTANGSLSAEIVVGTTPGGELGNTWASPTLDDNLTVAGWTLDGIPNTGLHVLDSDATHDLIFSPGSNLTADRTLTITTGDSNRTLTLSGNADISGTTSGTNTGDQTSVTGNAGTVTFADAGGDTTTFCALGTAATGSLAPATDAGCTYDATNNTLAIGTVDLTPTTGTFGITYETACSTTPTATFDYYKVGGMVTVQLVSTSGFPCTADSTQFSTSDADIPSAIRPTSTNVVSDVHDAYTNNGAAAWGEIQFNTDGTASFNLCATIGTACGLWTGSGNRSVAAGKMITYLTTNP